jgi:galactokinase
LLSQYSFCPVRHERDIRMPADQALVIGISGVVAQKTGQARDRFNRASGLISKMLHLWRSQTGRNDATLAAAVRSNADAPDRLRDILRRQLPDQSEPLLLRLDQFIRECEQIIPAAGDALLAGDFKRLGELVAESQQLAQQSLQNQVPETRALARLARECGATASSAFGAGFGGSVWALVHRASAHDLLNDLQGRYLAEFPHRADHASFFITSAARPAFVKANDTKA